MKLQKGGIRSIKPALCDPLGLCSQRSIDPIDTKYKTIIVFGHQYSVSGNASTGYNKISNIYGAELLVSRFCNQRGAENGSGTNAVFGIHLLRPTEAAYTEGFSFSINSFATCCAVGTDAVLNNMIILTGGSSSFTLTRTDEKHKYLIVMALYDTGDSSNANTSRFRTTYITNTQCGSPATIGLGNKSVAPSLSISANKVSYMALRTVTEVDMDPDAYYIPNNLTNPLIHQCVSSSHDGIVALECW